jgi:ATP-dependent DNA helicase RecG
MGSTSQSTSQNEDETSQNEGITSQEMGSTSQSTSQKEDTTSQNEEETSQNEDKTSQNEGITSQEMGSNSQSTSQNEDETSQKTIQNMIFAMLKAEPNITREELAKSLHLTIYGVKYHLQLMRKEGIVKYEGTKRGGKWVICH